MRQPAPKAGQAAAFLSKTKGETAMGEQKTTASSVNRAKTYQLVLFPLNNGATNVYYVLVLSYIATFGSKVLALSMIFASVMVTGMRLFDAITDPMPAVLGDRLPFILNSCGNLRRNYFWSAAGAVSTMLFLALRALLSCHAHRMVRTAIPQRTRSNSPTEFRNC